METRSHKESTALSEEKAANKSFKDLVHNFMEYTTAHGIGRLAASQTLCWKIFWSLVCLGAFGMFTFQAMGLFEQYFSKPVATSVSVTFEKHLSFPAVTICNLNKLRRDSIPEELLNVIKSWNQTNNSENTSTKSPTTDSFTTSSASNSDDDYYDDDRYNDYRYEGDVFDYNDDNEEEEEEFPDENKLRPEVRLRIQIDRLIAGMDEHELAHQGHQFNTLINVCSWKGIDCKSGNWSKFWVQQWDHKYGNCFTFNGGSDEDGQPLRILKATKAGPTNGLVLDINVEQENYIGPLTEHAGIQVLLHGQGSMIFPFEEGFSVPPGISTSVGIKRAMFSRLDRSNKSCLKIDKLSAINIYRRHKNITVYSQLACLKSCLGLSQRIRCKCSETPFPSDGTPCDPFDRDTRKCLRDVKYLFTGEKLKCLESCTQPCKEDVIRKTISFSEWPSKAYKKHLSSQGHQHSDSNDLQLSVFFNELYYERIEENFSYGTINLLADIGGQLGLWIGISVITVFELMELIVMFITFCMKKMNTGSKFQDGRVHGL